MSEHDDGGPAFPVFGNAGKTADLKMDPAKCGMSLRDWFAGQILSAVSTGQFTPAEIYAGADAMLAERKKG